MHVFCSQERSQCGVVDMHMTAQIETVVINILLMSVASSYRDIRGLVLELTGLELVQSLCISQY